MSKHDPEKNFEVLWKTFNKRYPFFKLRNVDWNKQYQVYRPKVTSKTSDDELFNIVCQMLDPLNDGHVELEAKLRGKKRYFNPEKKPRFWQEFTKREIKQLFKTTEKTLVRNGFGRPKENQAWMLHYCRSWAIGYIRILELEGVKKRDLKAALDTIAADFDVSTALSSISVTARAATIVLQSRSSIDFATASESPSAGGQRSARANMIIHG